MNSKTALIVQVAGISLIAVLSFFLTRSLKSVALRYWTIGWHALLFSLVGALAAFVFEPFSKLFLTFYFFGQYVFGFLLIAGCSNYVSDERLPARNWHTLFPFSLLALALALLHENLSDIYNIHAFVMGTAFLFAFFAIKGERGSLKRSLGWNLMRASLVLLAIVFYNYSISFTAFFFSYSYLPGWYVSFAPIFDLVLEVLVGFGMIIVLLERVLENAEDTNRRLAAAHTRMEEMAHLDPLTTAFNRHAFYSFLKKREQEETSGSVGVFDIDNLKPINDRLGHAAGDLAIRAVAQAIRSLIRADDLLFRWGGDEFFVVMVGSSAAQSQTRMKKLELLLENVKLYEVEELLTIRVSFGFAGFDAAGEIEKAVEIADAEMYKAKQKKKAGPRGAVSAAVRETSGAAVLNG